VGSKSLLQQNLLVLNSVCLLAYRFTCIMALKRLLRFVWVVDDARCILVTCFCLCLSVCGRMPTLLHEQRCNLSKRYGVLPSCGLLGGFRTQNVSECLYSLYAWLLLLFIASLLLGVNVKECWKMAHLRARVLWHFFSLTSGQLRRFFTARRHVSVVML